MFLEAFRLNNQNYFDHLHKKSQQFVEFLDQLKRENAGSAYNNTIHEIYD